MSRTLEEEPFMLGGMKTIMKLEDLTTIEPLENFRSGTPAVACSVLSDKDACDRWIQKEWGKFCYLQRPRLRNKAGRPTTR